MAQAIQYERSSEAAEPGLPVAVATGWTEVHDETLLDGAKVAHYINGSDEWITLRLCPVADADDDDHPEFAGIPLAPNGGTWDEDYYAGAVCARHHGASGTKTLSLVVV